MKLKFATLFIAAALVFSATSSFAAGRHRKHHRPHHRHHQMHHGHKNM
ncbi:MAG: hypothetical protein JSS82_16425 [Bacteroidetes bacterium]|nr:hypothetical protein [Bacteroidota bacterium]